MRQPSPPADAPKAAPPHPPMPGEVVLLRADVLSRPGLARLIADTRGWPLSHVACVQTNPSLVPGYHSFVAIGPGWLSILKPGEALSALERLPLRERPGLGMQHLGGRWPATHPDASLALARLLESRGIGPTLSQVAKKLGWNATALGRTIRREASVSYPDLRLRRGLLLLAGHIACEGKSFTAAAQAMSWERSPALRAFRSVGVDWRRFVGPSGRSRIVPESHRVIVGRANASKRDCSVAEYG